MEIHKMVKNSPSQFCFFYFKILFIDSQETQREMQRYRERERQRETRLPMGSPMWDSILGPRDHNLSRRQMLNR